jgi:hypothetical protein
MFIFPNKMKPITNGFKPHISSLLTTFISITLLLALQILTGKCLRILEWQQSTSQASHISQPKSKLFTKTTPLVLTNHLTGNARSVVESSFHNNQHEQHNQLVSNRHQGGGSGPSAPNGGNEKLAQSASFSGNHNRCQQGWVWVNNKCWVTTQSRRDFTHAMDLCKKMYNSTLPTIHSEEENEFLRNKIDSLASGPIWLFARHNHQYNKTRWLDKSPVDYTHWDDGQPSDKSSLVCIKTEDTWYMRKATPIDGQTECVSFWEDAKWGTNVGCQVLLPVVCEKKLTPVSRLTDGPNGSLSQFEQQMATMSGASQSLDRASVSLTIALTLITILLTGGGA